MIRHSQTVLARDLVTYSISFTKEPRLRRATFLPSIESTRKEKKKKYSTMSDKQNQSTTVAGLFRLDGKTAIVTGATGGLGLVLTLALAEAGANIVSIQLPNDKGGDKLREKVEGLGREFKAFHSNLRDYGAIPQTFADIWKAGVQPDILLHCAGITRHCALEDTPLEFVDDASTSRFAPPAFRELIHFFTLGN